MAGFGGGGLKRLGGRGMLFLSRMQEELLTSDVFPYRNLLHSNHRTAVARNRWGDKKYTCYVIYTHTLKYKSCTTAEFSNGFKKNITHSPEISIAVED